METELSRIETTGAGQVHARRWAILGVLCLSLLLIVMDNTIVNVALPTIQRELGASNSQLQWIVDSYILVFAGLLLTAGALGDRFGRKGALQVGLGVMILSSLLSAQATSAAELIATRALLGVGAAFVMPATLSILTNVFRDPKERGRAIAIWAATSGMAVALGPVTGGWLLDRFDWTSVFYVNIPVALLALALGRMIVPTSKDPAHPPLDVPGAVLSITGLVALVWSIIHAGESGWTATATVSGFAVAASLLTGFALWERRTPTPMLDVSVFKNLRFSAASSAITLTFFSMFGSLFLFTQYLQFVLGYSPLESGVRLLPMAATSLLVAPQSARLVERFGTKVVVGTGLLVASAGLLLTATLSPTSSYGEIAVRLVVLSGGLALVMAPATESIMGSLPPAKAGVGSAVNDTTREIGGALGVAVLGSILTSAYSSQLADAGVPAAVQESLGAAVGTPFLAQAADAFVDAMSTSVTIGAIVAAVGAALVFKFLPARAAEPGQDVDTGTDLDAELEALEESELEPALA